MNVSFPSLPPREWKRRWAMWLQRDYRAFQNLSNWLRFLQSFTSKRIAKGQSLAPTSRCTPSISSLNRLGPWTAQLPMSRNGASQPGEAQVDTIWHIWHDFDPARSLGNAMDLSKWYIMLNCSWSCNISKQCCFSQRSPGFSFRCLELFPNVIWIGPGEALQVLQRSWNFGVDLQSANLKTCTARLATWCRIGALQRKSLKKSWNEIGGNWRSCRKRNLLNILSRLASMSTFGSSNKHTLSWVLTTSPWNLIF